MIHNVVLSKGNINRSGLSYHLCTSDDCISFNCVNYIDNQLYFSFIVSSLLSIDMSIYKILEYLVEDIMIWS